MVFEMIKNQLGGSFYMLALPLVLAGSLWVQHWVDGGGARWQGRVAAAVGGIYDYADEVSRLVQRQKIERLAKLNIPAADRGDGEAAGVDDGVCRASAEG